MAGIWTFLTKLLQPFIYLWKFVLSCLARRTPTTDPDPESKKGPEEPKEEFKPVSKLDDLGLLELSAGIDPIVE